VSVDIVLMLDSELWRLVTKEKGLLGFIGLRKKKVYCCNCGVEICCRKQVGGVLFKKGEPFATCSDFDCLGEYPI